MNYLNNEKGQSLVEFVLILPIILLILMGILEFGIMLNTYLTINHASREGARLGSIGSTDTAIVNEIISKSPELEVEKITVTITPSQDSRSRGNSITVLVHYDYTVMFPLISAIINESVGLEAQTSMRIE